MTHVVLGNSLIDGTVNWSGVPFDRLCVFVENKDCLIAVARLLYCRLTRTEPVDVEDARQIEQAEKTMQEMMRRHQDGKSPE